MTKISLITGGSRGLGRAMALALGQRGGDVVVTYHSRSDDADAVVAELREMGRTAVALQLDTAKVAGFADFADRLKQALSENWGRDSIDHLVNNAGYGEYATIPETSEAQFDGLVDVHLKGVFFLTQTLLPMIADGGRIVNVSSGLTRIIYPGYAAYAAMKGAIEVLSQYMAKELGSRGIAVNTIAPGAIETDFGGGAVRDTPDLNAQIASMTALGRVGVPDDIGMMVASLLSEDNRWVNAQRIEVSGGQGI